MFPARLIRRGVVMLAMAASTAAAQNLVLDDDMSSPSYASSSFASFSNPDDLSFGDYLVSGSGGNPGAHLIIEHFHDVDRDEFGEPINGDGDTFVQSYFINQSTTYTPSVSGGIASLSFSLDYRTTDPFSGIFFDVSDLSGGSSAGFTYGLEPDGQWRTLTVTGLTQADFGGRDLSGSNPLSFGFGALSSFDATFDPTGFAMDVDNFTVTVNPIPEPGPALLVGLGAWVFLLRRRGR